MPNSAGSYNIYKTGNLKDVETIEEAENESDLPSSLKQREFTLSRSHNTAKDLANSIASPDAPSKFMTTASPMKARSVEKVNSTSPTCNANKDSVHGGWSDAARQY